MCKVMMIAGIKNKHRDNAIKFTKQISMFMSKHNDHGLGYAATDSKGNIFGERWLYNETAWENNAPKDSSAERILNAFPNATDAISITQPFEYNSFGKVKLNDVTSIMLHTRFATSAKGMNNTHPFVTTNNKTALIHNGIISNDSDFKLTLSTCDSESILVSYLNNDVKKDITLIQQTANELEGYYACGILTTDNNDVNIMDIFRANGARLSMCYVYELDTFVFSTDEADIKATCSILEFTRDEIYTVKDETIIRINAITGDMIDTYHFRAAPRYKTNNNFKGIQDHSGWNVNSIYKKQQPMSNHMIEYMKQTPSICRISEREMQEEIFTRQGM